MWNYKRSDPKSSDGTLICRGKFSISHIVLIPLGIFFFGPQNMQTWSMDPNITDGEAFVVLTAVMVEYSEKVSVHLEFLSPGLERFVWDMNPAASAAP